MFDDLKEQKYIFNKVVSSTTRAVKVDLGCGTTKQQGFIGIDRFSMPGVDIIADMNKILPLDNDSVDYLVASHSIEHAEDILFTMQEIYRICRHKALVCIVAPYSNTSLNAANPFHKQVFNEHTPRFFTNSNHTMVEAYDYEFPNSSKWGLAESDNSTCKLDFRCLKIEYFYFPEYRLLNEDEKRKLRQTSINIVDQIMYHLLVVKESISDEEIENMAKNIEYQEPSYITLRRCREEIDNLTLQKETLKHALDFEQTKAQQLELQLNIEKEHNEHNEKNMQELELQLKEEKEQNEKNGQEIEQLVNNKKILSDQFLEMENIIGRQILEHVNNSFRKGFRLTERIRRITHGLSDLSESINQECRPILEASILQSSYPLHNYVLDISPFIRNNDIFAYKIYVQEESIKGLRIVLSCIGVVPEGKTPLAIEILSQDETILRSVYIESGMIKNNLPIAIDFDHLSDYIGRNLWVRFVGMTDVEKYGIRIYEWQKYSKVLKRKIDQRIFAETLYS